MTVDSEFVRDVQICLIPEQFDSDDGWKDAFGELVLGIYHADIVGQAIEKAAIEHGVSGEILYAYELANY